MLRTWCQKQKAVQELKSEFAVLLDRVLHEFDERSVE
jgi:hypothetical protein